MGYSNQTHANSDDSNWVARHPLLVGTVIYALLCIPAYFWLQGPVATQGIAGTVGHVPVSVAIGGLVLGSILIVPAITSLVANRFAIERSFDTEDQ